MCGAKAQVDGIWERMSSSILQHSLMHCRRTPSAPMLYWTMDGWTVELLYQKTETTSVGKKHSVKNWDNVVCKEIADSTTTTYHNRLAVVIVLGPCENIPLDTQSAGRKTTT
jgi:hypothetical protein